MGKKLGTFLLTILSSVLLLCGCDDPYKNFALSVSTKEIVLYLDSDADNTEYPSTGTFNVKVSGTSKSVSGDITITQHAYNGVDDIVSVEAISDDTTSKNSCNELIRLSYLAFEVSIEPVRISSMLFNWLSVYAMALILRLLASFVALSSIS